MRRHIPCLVLLVWLSFGCERRDSESQASRERPRPNIVIVYADDVGYGDLGVYGGEQVATPHLDRLASEGLRFTDAYATAATCTPSRYSLLTGEYAFRNDRARILDGDAPLLIEPGSATLPAMLRDAGYRTAIVGKWHLGLGEGEVDWNRPVSPGPLEVGFDESFILPATNDRVPTVYLDGHHVAGLDPEDPIRVSYDDDPGELPTGADHPELLRYPANPQHSGTIIHETSRIGFMAGGRSAWWVDEDMADVFVERAVEFMTANRESPFFLFLSLADIHVPRLPHPRFEKEDLDLRRAAIAEMDWTVGAVADALDELGLAESTLLIYTSDNGPVIDDGYDDGALEALNGHDPSGPYRGGKYQAWEGGTRMPFIVHWPETVSPGVSSALLSQVDLPRSLVSLAGGVVPPGAAADSEDHLAALLVRDAAGRGSLLQQAVGAMALRRGRWKFIAAGERIEWADRKHDRPGDTTNSPPLSPEAQLYDLDQDPGETTNVLASHPELGSELAELLTATMKESAR